VDIIVGGFNIGWLKNRQESASRIENLSGHVKFGYGKPGKIYNNSKNKIIFVSTCILIEEFTNFSFLLLPKWRLKNC
jgi:hypothetical protein